VVFLNHSGILYFKAHQSLEKASVEALTAESAQPKGIDAGQNALGGDDKRFRERAIYEESY